MAGRRVTSEEEARRCLAAARAAGSKLGAWAVAHGLDGRSLNAWRLNLERREAPAQEAPRLVELVPVGPQAPAARYLLHLGGLTVELGDDFRDESVRRLVELLKSC